jgi:hypothetical protein
LSINREIRVFPRTVGNTGNYREILGLPGNYQEILDKAVKIVLDWIKPPSWLCVIGVFVGRKT